MNLRRRQTSIIISLMLVSVLFTGCGFMRGSAEPTPFPPVEMELVSFEAGAWNEAEDTLINQYQELQPNVSFNKGMYIQTPSAYLSQPPMPDLMVISPGYLLDQAIYNQQLVELTDIWEQSGLADDYPASFRALSANDGKQYYLPVAYTWTAIYYNEDVFAEYGLVPPATWDEFIVVCDTLLANGVTPLSIAGSDVFQSTLWFDYLNLRLNGLEFHQQLTRGEVSFEDARVHNALQLWSWMLERGYFVDHPERMNANDNVLAVVNTVPGLADREKAAMTLTGPTWLGSVPAELRSGLDFFAFPVIDPDVPAAEALTAYGYMIPAGAVNRGTALDFVKIAGSTDAQSGMAMALNASDSGLVPANPAAHASDMPASSERGASLVTNASGVTPFFVLAVPDSMWDPVGRAIGYFLQNPWDVQTTASMLENARQNALSAGDFLPVD